MEELESEYAPSKDIFTQDSEEMTRIKEIVSCELEIWQRRLLLLYITLGSYASVARTLNCSVSSIAKLIKEIRLSIQEKYGSDKYNYDNEGEDDIW